MQIYTQQWDFPFLPGKCSNLLGPFTAWTDSCHSNRGGLQQCTYTRGTGKVDFYYICIN